MLNHSKIIGERTIPSEAGIVVTNTDNSSYIKMENKRLAPSTLHDTLVANQRGSRVPRPPMIFINGYRQNFQGGNHPFNSLPV